MRIGFYNFYDIYNHNRMFLDSASPIGDDLMYPFVHLAEYLRDHGHIVATIDTAPLEEFDAVVFFDYPTKLNRYFRKLLRGSKTPLYLVTFEAETLRPDNWHVKNHRPFRKIFTWKTTLVDGQRYIWLNFSSRIVRDRANFDCAIKDRFCTVISGNKFSSHSLELYSERERAIRWFESHHHSQFDLYGIGWDRLYLPAWVGKLNFALAALYRKMPWLPRTDTYPSYRGPLKCKRQTLRRYRFSICYENAVIPGYVTEKIFDCFMAGVVPIYLGAPNIKELVPENTFIDKRSYPTYEALYERLESITEDEHRRYLEAIWQFLGSDGVKPWGAEYFAHTLEREIVS